MNSNPYESPKVDLSQMPAGRTVGQGRIVFILAMIAFIAATLVGWTGPTISFAMSLLMFLSIPGLLICIVELTFVVQKRLPTWGVFISLFVMAYLPTVIVGLRGFLRSLAD